MPERPCEHAGDTSPDGLQHLLGRAKRDADLVRDDLRAFVLDHLADDQAVLVVDETSGLKKGTHTVGVQRQYTPAAVPARAIHQCRRSTRAGTGPKTHFL